MYKFSIEDHENGRDSCQSKFHMFLNAVLSTQDEIAIKEYLEDPYIRNLVARNDNLILRHIASERRPKVNILRMLLSVKNVADNIAAECHEAILSADTPEAICVLLEHYGANPAPINLMTILLDKVSKCENETIKGRVKMLLLDRIITVGPLPTENTDIFHEWLKHWGLTPWDLLLEITPSSWAKYLFSESERSDQPKQATILLLSLRAMVSLALCEYTHEPKIEMTELAEDFHRNSLFVQNKLQLAIKQGGAENKYREIEGYFMNVLDSALVKQFLLCKTAQDAVNLRDALTMFHDDSSKNRSNRAWDFLTNPNGMSAEQADLFKIRQGFLKNFDFNSVIDSIRENISENYFSHVIYDVPVYLTTLYCDIGGTAAAPMIHCACENQIEYLRHKPVSFPLRISTAPVVSEIRLKTSADVTPLNDGRVLDHTGSRRSATKNCTIL